MLRQLQATLARLAPRMSVTLEVHAYERDRARRRVELGDPDALRAVVVAKGTERGPTFHALVRSHGAPTEIRRFETVMLRGRGAPARGLYLSVDFDSLVPARPAGSVW